ncbi:reverse transcriptase domain-containing protein [Tanacetum coccineum]
MEALAENKAITRMSVAQNKGAPWWSKPAEQSPLSALYCANLAKLAHIPDGVIHVVTAFGPTARAATSSHMNIDCIRFTGSTEVVRLVLTEYILVSVTSVVIVTIAGFVKEATTILGVENRYMVTLVDGVLANGVVMIFEMDIAFYAIQGTEILSLMIRLRILSIILSIFHTHLHNPNTYHILMSYVGTMPIMVMIVHLKEKAKVLLIAWDRFCEIKHTCGDKQQQELLRKLLKDVQNVKEELAEDINTLNWDRPAFYYDDDDDEESSIPLRDIIIYGLPPCIEITPVLSIMEPEDSLSMGDKHPSTILEMESDKVLMSSVENLVPSPSESKDISDESFSKKDVPMENFKIFSNPLFDLDEEIISTKVNPICNEVLESIDSIPPGIDHFDAEFDLLESLLNRDISINSSPKIDYILDEFAGELTLLKSIPPGIDESKFDPEGDISLTERLLYDNSSPRPPEELNVENYTQSFPLSHIPVEDSDPLMEEIDLFLASDGSIPPGIDCDYSDSEGDNLFLERLLHDDPIPLPEYDHEPNVLPTQPTLNLDDFTYVVRVLLPFFTYILTSPFLLSSGSENTIFDPGISVYYPFMPGVSHRSGTFMKFNVYPNHLNESPMEILSFTCSPMDQ